MTADGSAGDIAMEDVGGTAAGPSAVDGIESRLSALLSERPIWSHELLEERLGSGGSADVHVQHGSVDAPTPASTSVGETSLKDPQEDANASQLLRSLSRLTYRFKTGVLLWGRG